ncbi:MAG: methyl-accepting chemotaxis protein, partial [Nitrospiraceae bacterium]|nr:methyl-accepting chemotaxis protein [Nitrospiraceae bacterium]
MKFPFRDNLKLDTSLRRLWLFFMILPLLIVYLLLGVLSISGIYFDSQKRINEYRQMLLSERQAQVRGMVDLIVRSVAGMPRRQALDMVRKLSPAMGDDSFWILDGEKNTFLYNNGAPASQKNAGARIDGAGANHVLELARTAEDRGEGSLVYSARAADGRAYHRVVYAKEIGKLNWLAAADAGARDIEQAVAVERTRIYEGIIWLIARTVAISLAAVAILFWIVRRYADRFLTGPVNTFVATLRNAQNDLTVRIPVTERNEFGEIAQLFNAYMENLRKIMRKVSDAALDINSHSNEISGSVEEQAAVLTEQSAAVTEITSTMEELSASSSQIAEHSKAVVDTANKTCDDLKVGAKSVEAVITKMTEIGNDNEKSMQEINELGKKSKEISKIMNIINNIADQTKLIAFNAALEASSAGEAGKRFAVVAVEIRRLADSVMESTGEIESKISEIQE